MKNKYLKFLIEKLKIFHIYSFNKRYIKSWNEMTLFEQYKYARDNFQHYSIRYIYVNGDGFRIVSNEEKQHCFDMANKWDSIIKELRLKIIESSNIC